MNGVMIGTIDQTIMLSPFVFLRQWRQAWFTSPAPSPDAFYIRILYVNDHKGKGRYKSHFYGIYETPKSLIFYETDIICTSWWNSLTVWLCSFFLDRFSPKNLYIFNISYFETLKVVRVRAVTRTRVVVITLQKELVFWNHGSHSAAIFVDEYKIWWA